LPTTKSGNDTIVTIIDGLSKHVRWLATTEANLPSERFAELFIEHYVHHRGNPVSIVSDRDTRFMGEFRTTLTKRLGTKLRFSTTFYPHTDGLAEKANSTIKTFLRAYAVENVQNWDHLLPLAEFTYNSSKHKTTKRCPFEVDIGYVPRLPLDLLIDPQSQNITHTTNASLDVNLFTQTLQTQAKQIRERLGEARDTMVELANRNRYPHSFKSGDQVFLDTSKLQIGYANVSSSSRKL
jgi:hypothetical protein